MKATESAKLESRAPVVAPEPPKVKKSKQELQPAPKAEPSKPQESIRKPEPVPELTLASKELIEVPLAKKTKVVPAEVPKTEPSKKPETVVASKVGTVPKAELMPRPHGLDVTKPELVQQKELTTGARKSPPKKGIHVSLQTLHNFIL